MSWARRVGDLLHSRPPYSAERFSKALTWVDVRGGRFVALSTDNVETNRRGILCVSIADSSPLAGHVELQSPERFHPLQQNHPASTQPRNIERYDAHSI
ncbi:hypothetical protein BD410DRAFT_796867 [Rickenella mellea]|uniref:Uncharacterized protein n=1 Tax=Rickenella mellea TaxID=50990 RepID=A0A4Y7PK48_9AGAM|nr:hypothetical protein BD410DRAFT_796867 [Rickenella mellea]